MPTTHFSWRNANVSVYKAFGHQHLNEIGRNVQLLGRQDRERAELPARCAGPFARGIFVTTYVQTDESERQLKGLFRNFLRQGDLHPRQRTGTPTSSKW